MAGMSRLIGLRSRLQAIPVLFALLLGFFAPLTASAQAYVGKPKLIVYIIIDQFRGDYLNRWQDEFKGRGFNLFMKDGAWFTDCYYDYANTKTAPGHSTIGTGAYTDGTGIEANEWWDASRSDTHQVSSVEDERYQLVDLPASSIPVGQKYVIGASPLNLRASTLGDELRLATQGKSKVFGISLKDRAAILPVGQSANGAFWIDQSSGQYTTSTYYMQHLPAWATAFNASDRRAEAEKQAQVPGTTEFYDLVGRTPAANSYELDFAKALITGEKLGQSGVTDLLSISLSANDIQGHQFGPDSPFEKQMVLSLDSDLDNFFTWLDQNIGLNNVWIALTADHGVAPIPGEAANLGMNAVAVDAQAVYDSINATLNKRHSPGASIAYLMPTPDLPYIVLNKKAFEKVRISEQSAEEEVAALLPDAVASLPHPGDGPLPAQHRLAPRPRVHAVYTRLELAHGEYPHNQLGELLSHSYAYHGNWFVMLVLDPYQLQGTGQFAGTTHFSPWSYDRHVPLAFYGTPFKPGEYHNLVQPVDLAVTFASLAGVNRPSAAVGHVLTEALKNSGQ